MKAMFIDVESISSGKKIFNRLKRLKSVSNIQKPVNYFFGCIQRECVILLETSMTETELDSWLYKSNLGYIGCGLKN